MRVLLIGYGEMFCALARGIICSGHELVSVLRSDTINRNWFIRVSYDYLKPTMEYLFIKTHGINEIIVDSVNSEKFREILKSLAIDVVIVGSWSEKISKKTLDTLPNGFINVHSSLLPKYRGPNPYIHIILNKETKSAVTFHLMDLNYDTGDILHQKEIPVLSNDTGGSLKIRCCKTAEHEIGFLLNNFQDRLLHRRIQDETQASYQPQITLKETIIDFVNQTSEEIDSRIRALSPWQECYLPLKDLFLTFNKYEITKLKSRENPATIVDKTNNSIDVVCRDLTIIRFFNLEIKYSMRKYFFYNFWSKIKIGEKVK